MKDLDAIIRRIEAELDEKDEVREVALKSARSIVRLAGASIRGMHRGEAIDGTLATAREETQKLRALLSEHPDLWFGGAVEGALQEVSEAAIVRAIVSGSPLPSPTELGVTSPAYLLGLADAVGRPHEGAGLPPPTPRAGSGRARGPAGSPPPAGRTRGPTPGGRSGRRTCSCNPAAAAPPGP